MVLVGARHKPGFYAGLVKNLFAQDKYEEIVLQGRGEKGVLRTTQSASILTRWGYCEVLRLKTKMDRGPTLKVVLRKAATFEEQHSSYQKQIEERKAQQAKEAEEVDSTEKKELEVEEPKTKEPEAKETEEVAPAEEPEKAPEPTAVVVSDQ